MAPAKVSHLPPETSRASRTPERRSLENSEQEFLTRYAEFAASGTLYPQIEGSPLMEFSSAGRVLFLFDRTGPYRAHPGPARGAGVLCTPATFVGTILPSSVIRVASMTAKSTLPKNP